MRRTAISILEFSIDLSFQHDFLPKRKGLLRKVLIYTKVSPIRLPQVYQIFH